MKGIIGKSNRFSVNIDELRTFNPRLANFVVKNPIEAIKMFQDQLNAKIRGLHEEGGKAGNEKQALMADNFPRKH